ncbi:MAG: efflux RND transporter periplasmic adaptor subunit, partial [Pseudomonadota bacterium]
MTDAVPASKLRRAARIGGRVLSTVLTALLAVGAVALATGTIETRASQAPAPEAAPPATVSAAPLTVQPGYSVTRHFVGQVEPQQRIDVAFEAGGTVAEIVVAEGDRVAEGALLARLDTRALEADRRSVLAAQAALMAQLELAERTAERAEGLGESGFASQQRLDEARLAVAELTARVAETTARLEVIDVALDKAVLRAPFSGEIGARAADPGQTLAAGAAVLTLLQDGAAELHIGLPPALAATLEPGLEVESTVAGQTQMAVLDQLQPDLDPATRTQTAIFRLTGTAAFGQAGRI